MPQQPKQALPDSGLALNVPAQPTAPSSSKSRPNSVCEGWLLKKRRKKLQGYAKRYFILDHNGILAYAFEPGSTIRDQISLPSAAISSSQARKDIHVDSGRVTFHLKCLREADFDKWMDALRKFTPTGSEMERVTTRRSHSRAATLTMKPQAGKLQQAALYADEIGKTIDDIIRVCYLDNVDSRIPVNFDRGQGSSPSSSAKSKEDKGHPLLSLFKKPSPSMNAQMQNAFQPHDGLPNSTTVSYLPEQLAPLLSKLRSQHGSLSELLQSVSPIRLHHKTPFQEAIDEEGPYTSMGLPSWNSCRSSISTVTDGGSVFFDANDGEELGAEEYVVQEDPEELSSIRDTPSAKTESIQDDEDVDYDSTRLKGQTPEERPPLPVDRRTRLPVRPPGDEGSLFAILKKNVGQDLSNISFPVTFNEPSTLLQRTAEELEYHVLLNNAASTTDWIERICYIAAFAVSGYACTKYRGARKGFTPLLCETFEEARLNFIAEKVVHKPLVIAYHADGPGWELNATSSGKTKFWGKSFEVIPTGITRLKLGSDVFEWNKPSSFTRNLMMGTKYLEHCGEMVIKNTTSGAQCILDFKETGYWASNPNMVTGTVYSGDGKTVSKLEGKWDEQMAQKLDFQHLKILWRVTPFPRDAAVYYGYTYFTITLNEITPDIQDKLPPTDSRFRPDVRALEEGDVARAEAEKVRIEQMQRERRERGAEPKPRWFRQVDGSDEWVYSGGYWEARRKHWKKNTEEIKPLW